MTYMRETETLTPEIEMKAQQYVNLGYQRILTFECADGGFNWWVGDNPGNAVLSALVIMMLTDTKAVTFVDESVIARTQDWLAAGQRSDGSWSEEQHLHAGNETLGTSSLRATAYIAWGLAHSGYTGPALASAMSYIAANVEGETDLYTLGMCANALAVGGGSANAVERIARKLHEARVEEDGGKVHWSAGGTDTMCGSSGGNADIETTANVTLALIHAGAYPADVEGAITWLIGMKDPQGNWGYSTQATVQVLKVLVEALSGDAGVTDADVTVRMDGEVIETRHFDAFNKDVLWQVDLSERAVEGENRVEVTYTGIGNLMYQVVSTYYLPWDLTEPDANGPLTIEVEYDKTELAVNDTVTVNVTVTNSDPLLAGMVLIDLGRPPGFTLATEDFEALRAAGTIQEYETTDKQILVYLNSVPVESGVRFAYHLTAEYPLEATVPGSSVAPYYNAEQRSETPDVPIEVN